MNSPENTTSFKGSVSDQDLRNGLGSLLEFVGYALELAESKGAKAGRDYLKEVGADIITGRGHPAPNPGPVTPKEVLG